MDKDSQLKTFWKGLIILDATKKSWFMDDFEKFKTSVEEVTENTEEIARELELEVEPEDVLNCYLMIKTWTDEELSLMDEQRKWFLEIESTPGKNAVRTVEMTTNDLDYYINLIDQATTGPWGLNTILKKFYCG